jgi:hypothetical protein
MTNRPPDAVGTLPRLTPVPHDEVAPTADQPAGDRRRMGILLSDEVEEIDAIGP